MRGDVGQDLVERVDVAAGGVPSGRAGRLSTSTWRTLTPRLRQSAAVLGGKPIHGGVGAEPGEQPMAVGDGAKAEEVLLAVLLDRVPGRAAAGFARAGDWTSNSGASRAVRSRRSGRESPRPAGGSAE